MTRTQVRIAVAFVLSLTAGVASAVAYSIHDDPVTRGAVGVPYRYQLEARGGSPPHRFRVSSGTLPPGISLTTGGLLTGIPTKSGMFEFYVEAKDAWNPPMYSQRLIQVGFVPKPPAAEVDKHLAVSLQTPREPALKWEPLTKPLPPGLTLDAAGSSLVGTPLTAGVHRLEFAASDPTGRTALLEIEVTVAPKPLLLPAQLGTTTVERRYVTSFPVRGGVAPFRWKIIRGRLPLGLRLNAATGVLSGRAKVTGRFQFKLSVTDAVKGASTRMAVLKVVRRKDRSGSSERP
jgi:hypothetical protein